jgi:hypothetical protein
MRASIKYHARRTLRERESKNWQRSGRSALALVIYFRGIQRHPAAVDNFP